MNVVRFQDDYLGIFTRSYLVQTERYNVFIDGGLLGGREKKLPYLTDGRKNVLLLTHGHWDHIGCDSLTMAHGGEVWVHEGDVKHVTDYNWHWEMLFGQFKEDFDLPPARHEIFWSMVGDPITPTRLLHDGDELVFDDLHLQVIATPGHSPGSICLYEPRSRTLFSGDSIIGNGFFKGTPQIADFDDYLDSMEKLRDWHPERVISAHMEDLNEADYVRILQDGIDCALRMRAAVADYCKTHDTLTVGGAAKAIAEKEGKGVGGGTCVTALAALKSLGESRAESLLDAYIYGY